MLELALPALQELALGGTAVGTGLNAPKGFDTKVAEAVSQLTGKPFVTAANKFHALTSKDELVFAHGAHQGPGCGPDEDRQRRALAGLRPPRRSGRDLHSRKTSPAPPSCPARSTPPSARP